MSRVEKMGAPSKLTWSDDEEMRLKREHIMENVKVTNVDRKKWEKNPSQSAATFRGLNGWSIYRLAKRWGMTENTLKASEVWYRPKPRIVRPEEDVPRQLDESRGHEFLLAFFAEKAQKQPESFRPKADLSKSQYSQYLASRRLMVMGWRIGGAFRKDPLLWEKDLFLHIRNLDELKDMELHPPLISFGNLVALRRLMRALKKPFWEDVDFDTRKSKRPKGVYQDWFLSKGDVTTMFNYAMSQANLNPCPYGEQEEWLEFAVAFMFLIHTGARSGSVLHGGAKADPLTISKLNRETGQMMVFESKTGKIWPKVLSDKMLKLLEMWIEYRIKNQLQNTKNPLAQPLFPSSKVTMTRYWVWTLDNTRVAATKGVAGRNVTWHITRHTFATHMAEANIPLEQVAYIGGWEDVTTLYTYYRGQDPKVIRQLVNRMEWM